MGAVFKIFELVDHSMLASRYLIIDIKILLSTMKKFVVLKFQMKIQQGTSMKKKFLAILIATIISVPTLFAFHDEDTDLLTAGMPVAYLVTGFKFTPQQHSAARAAIQTVSTSECYLSQRFNADLLVDQAGNGTMVLRWPTKESYMADQKTIADSSQPMGICESVGNMRMQLGKLHAANGGDPRNDLKASLMTAIASSPR